MNKFFMLLIFFVVYSCVEDELKFNESNNKEVINSNREEKFFLIKDIEQFTKSQTFIDLNFINKLKNINAEENFIRNLSDWKGIPQWSYAKHTGINIMGRGSSDESDFIIVPMREDERNNLSSLLYIKNPYSNNPEIHTITNDELFYFTHNQEIEKYDRESVLITFLYFDQQIFGENRKYTNIPLDLFESIPEAGKEEDHEHQKEEGFGYKEFYFTFTEQEGGTTEKLMQLCVEFSHCTGCLGTCDLCSICVSTECYSFGGGPLSNSGNPFGGDYPGGDYPGDHTGGGPGNSNNNSWYTYYPDYYDYHPKLQIICDRLHYYNLHLDPVNEIPYLNSQLKNKFYTQFIFPTTEPREYAEFIFNSIVFLCQNRDEVVQPEKFMERVEELSNTFDSHPFTLLNIPCSQFPKWMDVINYDPPIAVQNHITQLNQNYGSNNAFYIQKIEDADGAIVNMDFFPVTITNFPIDPHTGQPFTPSDFFESMRLTFNDYLNGGNAEFSAYNVNEGLKWYSSSYLTSLMRFDINVNKFLTQDGTVICIEQHSKRWKFATMRSPEDGIHPVSGIREFGYYQDINGKYVYYTRGVDRIKDATEIFLGDLFSMSTAFEGADGLWNKFQENLAAYVNNPINGNGQANINSDYKSRPDLNELKKVLLGQKPISSLPGFNPCN